MSDFSHLKAGDLVVIESASWLPILRYIVKVTKTQIHTNPYKFRIKDGRLVGDPYSMRIEIATPEKVKEISDGLEIRKITNRLSRLNWETLTLSALQAIDKIISEHTKP